MKKTAALRAGDKVGIIAPSARFNPENFKRGIATLKSWGLKPLVDKELFKKDFIFSGTPHERYTHLKKFLSDPEIKLIWTVRGGAGSYAVAPLLENLKLSKGQLGRPKILVGLSDITALHLVFNQKYGWPSVHGAMVDRLGHPNQPKKEIDSLKKLLFDSELNVKFLSGLKFLSGVHIKADEPIQGVVVGGNLSLVAASLGSSWEVKTDNKILFLEDLCEPAYRIDRMLTQLQNAGKFKKVRAVILGDFTECLESDGRELWKTEMKRFFSHAPFPVICGLPTGHGELRMPLPLGLQGTLTSKGHRIELQFNTSLVG